MKDFTFGRKYYLKNQCPECGRDLIIIHGICEYCIIWEEQGWPKVHGKKENEVFKEKYGCNYRLMSG
jgi:hypothetical protein